MSIVILVARLYELGMTIGQLKEWDKAESNPASAFQMNFF